LLLENGFSFVDIFGGLYLHHGQFAVDLLHGGAVQMLVGSCLSELIDKYCSIILLVLLEREL